MNHRIDKSRVTVGQLAARLDAEGIRPRTVGELAAQRGMAPASPDASANTQPFRTVGELAASRGMAVPTPGDGVMPGTWERTTSRRRGPDIRPRDLAVAGAATAAVALVLAPVIASAHAQIRPPSPTATFADAIASSDVCQAPESELGRIAAEARDHRFGWADDVVSCPSGPRVLPGGDGNGIPGVFEP